MTGSLLILGDICRSCGFDCQPLYGSEPTRVGKSFAGGLALTSRANLSSDRLKSSRDWRNALPAAPIIRASLMTLLRRIFYLDQPLQIMATPFFCLLSHLSVKNFKCQCSHGRIGANFPNGCTKHQVELHILKLSSQDLLGFIRRSHI